MLGNEVSGPVYIFLLFIFPAFIPDLYYYLLTPRLHTLGIDPLVMYIVNCCDRTSSMKNFSYTRIRYFFPTAGCYVQLYNRCPVHFDWLKSYNGNYIFLWVLCTIPFGDCWCLKRLFGRISFDECLYVSQGDTQVGEVSLPVNDRIQILC